jgi:crossover junction endodeoxyribonuclease RusA
VIELPFPPKSLWPNGRAHWAIKHRAATSAKLDAFMSMKGYLATMQAPAVPARIVYTIRPKTRNPIDRDNCVAAMKAYQDGICAALGIDDSTLDTPKIIMGEPVKGGAVIVEVE